jgi:hypothetical protein
MRHPSTEPLPNFCPLCGAQVNPEYAFVPEAPHLAKTIGKTADGVYRQMEEASRERMYQAAELTGDSASDYAGMAITDMPDYLHEGDIAAKIPAASQDSPVVKGAGFQGLSGAEYAAGVTQGFLPRRGEQMRQFTGTGHQDRVRHMVAQGTRARSS